MARTYCIAVARVPGRHAKPIFSHSARFGVKESRRPREPLAEGSLRYVHGALCVLTAGCSDRATPSSSAATEPHALHRAAEEVSKLGLPIDATWLTGKSNPYPRSGNTDTFEGNLGSRGAN